MKLDSFEECVRFQKSQLEWTWSLNEALVNCTSSGEVSVGGSRRSIRPLTCHEQQSVVDGCQCILSTDCTLYLLLDNSSLEQDQSETLRVRLSRNRFFGTVLIVCSKVDHEEENRSRRGGVHANDCISNCILDLCASVCGNACLENVYIGSNATVQNSRVVANTDNQRHFGCLSISVGPENGGGRKLLLRPDSDMRTVCEQLKNPQSLHKKKTNGDSASRMAVLCDNCTVLDSTVDSVMLYPNASVIGSTLTRAVLYPDSVVRNSTVTDAFLQWNASVTDYSVVSDTFLFEHAHAGPKSVVVESVLGPDVHVSCGEVHASAIGPNTNAHHQSLVIGVLWPLGRGNVGYGANVGSNHTGRLPDQETVAGEGTFWGLSTVIKFPVNLAEAPYSVVAAGTTMGPQRLRMPFSLIVGGTERKNLIVPGWVLRSSPYTVARSEQKFATRRKALRHPYTGWKIIRPETVELCRKARLSLQWRDQSTTGFFSESDIPGLGDNQLTERARRTGIEAYTDCIQRYALHGLLVYLEGLSSWSESFLQRELESVSTSELSSMSTGDEVRWPLFPWEVDMSDEWKYQLSLLASEFPCRGPVLSWIHDLLQRLVVLESRYAEQVLESKARDDKRGVQTIPGYSDSHVAAPDDPVVLQVQTAAQETQDKVAALLRKLSVD